MPPPFAGDLRALIEPAARVLKANDAGGWTRPSARQYPHQWNWDSALVSVGWAWIDWPRAVSEIGSLLEAQWDDGMVPHIRYDARRLDDYFPGPDRWPNAARHHGAGVLTSGISNPPILVTTALRVADRAPDRAGRKAFLEQVMPALERWLRYFSASRRLDDSPLVTVVHPWETGWDNSPRWDRLRAAELHPRLPFTRRDTLHVGSAQRPEDRDYEAYLALIEMWDGCDYSVAEYRRLSPFLVNDVFFDACWYRAATELNQIAEELGRRAPFDASELAEFAAAFEGRHWDPQLKGYYDYDVVAGDRIAVATPAGIAACISGLVPRERALAMWQAFLAQGPGLRPAWTLSPQDPSFDAVRYWRGPVWVHLNWLIALGLATSGLVEEAHALERSTLELVTASGFSEYYSPVDGAPAGATSFSWPAALVIDLVHRAQPG